MYFRSFSGAIFPITFQHEYFQYIHTLYCLSNYKLYIYRFDNNAFFEHVISQEIPNTLCINEIKDCQMVPKQEQVFELLGTLNPILLQNLINISILI